jgi:hypothetical protein
MRDGRPRPLGVGAHHAIAPAKPDRRGELLGEALDLLARPRGASGIVNASASASSSRRSSSRLRYAAFASASSTGPEVP